MKLTGIIKRNTMSLTPEYTFMAGPEEARKKITINLNKRVADQFEEEFLKGKEKAKAFREMTLEFKAVGDTKAEIDSHELADVVKKEEIKPINVEDVIVDKKIEAVEEIKSDKRRGRPKGSKNKK